MGMSMGTDAARESLVSKELNLCNKAIKDLVIVYLAQGKEGIKMVGCAVLLKDSENLVEILFKGTGLRLRLLLVKVVSRFMVHLCGAQSSQ